MKIVKLLTAAYVSGTLRHPHEGAIPVHNDEEARRLVEDDKVAEDVTDDFSAKQREEMTGEAITVASGGEPAPAAVNPHQAEVETDLSESTPARRRPAAHKE